MTTVLWWLDDTTPTWATLLPAACAAFLRVFGRPATVVEVHPADAAAVQALTGLEVVTRAYVRRAQVWVGAP
jgi:hypothetical protein